MERVPYCHHLFCYVFQSGWFVFCYRGVFGKGSMLPPFVLLCISVRLVSFLLWGDVWKGFHVATICSVMFFSQAGLFSVIGGCLERVPCCHHLFCYVFQSGWLVFLM